MDIDADDGAESRRARPSMFGKLVLAHRRAARLTQEEVATAAGISVRTLRNLERGHTQAAQHQSAEALADALGVKGDQRKTFLNVSKALRRRADREESPRPAESEEQPYLLPAMVPDFVGRWQELARVTSWCHDAEGTSGGTVVAVIGPAGVGKTTFATALLHHLAADFPDGQLSIDLRGMDDQPMSTNMVLGKVLRFVGVDANRIPPTVEERSSLLRLAFGRRRVLILLDNVANEAQIRPILVRAPGSLTVVTCRRALTGLEAARWLWLAPLPVEDSVTLLESIIDASRVRAEPDAVRELIRLCGNLPLAVRIAGNRLARQPSWTIASLVAELRDERTRLVALTAGDLQVRLAFELSYLRLATSAQHMFRRLVLVPGVDFGTDLVPVAAGVEHVDARRQLEDLVDATLVQPAQQPGRYQFHDLIRIYAKERLEAEETETERTRAAAAIDSHLMDTAAKAGSLFDPAAESATTNGVVTRNREWAVAWLDRESSNWLGAARRAHETGMHRQLIELARMLHWYSDAFQQHPWADFFSWGVNAARVIGDRQAEAVLLNFFGWAQGLSDPDSKARLKSHQEALAIAQDIGDRYEEAWALSYIAAALARMGQSHEALVYNESATELFTQLSYWPALNSNRNVRGRILRRMGRYEQALASHRAVLAELDRRRDQMAPDLERYHRASTLMMIGEIQLSKHDWAGAATILHQARMMVNPRDVPGLVGEAALQEGMARRLGGEAECAVDTLRFALTMFTDVTMGWWRVRTLVDLARALTQTGATADARASIDEALRLSAELDVDHARELVLKLDTYPDLE